MIDFKKIKQPLFIAEISANHNGSLVQAKKLIKHAKTYGADWVKIQTYEARNMTIKSNRKEFKITKGLWKNYNLWDLYEKGSTPLTWQKELFRYAKKINTKLFSSPFDIECVDFLETLRCPLYKVASFEMNDYPLIKRIAQTKKPMIISTGLANLSEIRKTVDFAKKNGAKDVALLYCVSNYPAKISDFNLNNIIIMKEKFKDCVIGLSDHSLDTDICKIAVAVGAKIIEKHIALDGQKKGLDLAFSLKGKEIKKFKNDIKKTYLLLGKNQFYRTKNEKVNLKSRRSIYSINKIRKNEKFTEKNIKLIRPANGLAPEYYFKIIGKKSTKAINSGMPLRKEYIK